MDTSTQIPGENMSVPSVIGYIQKTAEHVTLKTQQLLGRTASSKSQYMTIHPGDTFNTKHVKMVSVVLFLVCVSAGAMYSAIYYSYYWKPCTKTFLYIRNGVAGKHGASKTTPTNCATHIHANWDKYTWSTAETMPSCNKCTRLERVTPLSPSDNGTSNIANSTET